MGRMTQAQVNNNPAVEYSYNPAGMRYMRVENSVTKTWTYQGDNIASVENPTNSPNVHSVYTVDEDQIVGNVYERHDVDTSGQGSTTSCFYLYNHRGDAVGVTDSSRNLSRGFDYDAYGNVAIGSPATDDILLTGKDLDPRHGALLLQREMVRPGSRKVCEWDRRLTRR